MVSEAVFNIGKYIKITVEKNRKTGYNKYKYSFKKDISSEGAVKTKISKQKKEKSKETKRKLLKPGFWVAYVVAVVVMFSVFSVVMVSSLNTNRELLASKAELEESVKDEKQRKSELSLEGDYYSSDEYYEKVAREKLGLVMPNEIQFIDQNK